MVNWLDPHLIKDGTISAKTTILKGRDDVSMLNSDNYEEYETTAKMLGRTTDIQSRSNWMMHSPARRYAILSGMQAEVNALRGKADTRYEHFQWLYGRRHKGQPPSTTREVWEATNLTLRVNAVIELERKLNLPPSRWTPDTPDSDVVAW